MPPSYQRRGRPPRTSVDEILDTIERLGLRSFTIADLAVGIGVREATLYNYIGGRDEAYRAAAARIVARLDTADPASAEWPQYVETLCRRGHDLARAHPGIEPYVHAGPYLPSTVRVFESILDEVRSRLPGASEDTAYALAAPPFLDTISRANDDEHVAPLASWLRQSMIQGMALRLRRGDEVPQVGWRRLLTTAPVTA